MPDDVRQQGCFRERNATFAGTIALAAGSCCLGRTSVEEAEAQLHTCGSQRTKEQSGVLQRTMLTTPVPLPRPQRNSCEDGKQQQARVDPKWGRGWPSGSYEKTKGRKGGDRQRERAAPVLLPTQLTQSSGRMPHRPQLPSNKKNNVSNNGKKWSHSPVTRLTA